MKWYTEVCHIFTACRPLYCLSKYYRKSCEEQTCQYNVLELCAYIVSTSGTNTHFSNNNNNNTNNNTNNNQMDHNNEDIINDTSDDIIIS